MAVFCHQCGTALPQTARFCSNCGVVDSACAADGGQAAGQAAGWAGRLPESALALAQAYGWDLALVRILTVIGFFFSGGLVGVAYLAGWIGIPEEPLAMPGEMAAALSYPCYLYRYEAVLKQSDGTKISYYETGAGQPVVFLHPTPLDHFYWLPMAGGSDGGARHRSRSARAWRFRAGDGICRWAGLRAYPMRRC